MKFVDCENNDHHGVTVEECVHCSMRGELWSKFRLWCDHLYSMTRRC